MKALFVCLICATCIMCNNTIYDVYDNNKPVIETVAPVPEAKNVAINASVFVSFNEIMSPDSVNSTMIQVKLNNENIPGAIRYQNKTIIFTPAGNLAMNSEYIVSVRKDLKDMANNSLPSDYSWKFYTGTEAASSPLELYDWYPSTGSFDIPVNKAILVQFNYTISPASVTGDSLVLTDSHNKKLKCTTGVMDRYALLRPAAELEANSVYTVTVSSIESITGTQLNQTYSWQFLTGSETNAAVPFIIDRSPWDGGVDVAIDSGIIIKFNDYLDPRSVSEKTVMLLLGTDRVSGLVSYDMANQSVNFMPTAHLQYNSVYAVRVLPGIADLSGNNMQLTQEWSFTAINP